MAGKDIIIFTDTHQTPKTAKDEKPQIESAFFMTSGTSSVCPQKSHVENQNLPDKI